MILIPSAFLRAIEKGPFTPRLLKFLSSHSAAANGLGIGFIPF